MARTIAGAGTALEGQNRLALAGAIGLALLAAVFAFAALRAAGGEGDGGGTANRVDVVVASQPISRGEAISDGMLTLASVPEDAIIANALTALPALDDGLIASYPLEQGEQLTAAKLGQEGAGKGGTLPPVIPPGKRGVTVGVTEEKVFGGLLAPGDHVDVIAIVQRVEGEEEIPTAVMLVQNAEVLAVADEQLEPVGRLDIDGNPIVTDTSEGVLSEAPEDADTQPDARNVTLAVAPEDALLIALAQEEWSVWLSLRGPGDAETLPVAPRSLTIN
jgi:Flp pilus assembly protein CpaB